MLIFHPHQVKIFSRPLPAALSLPRFEIGILRVWLSERTLLKLILDLVHRTLPTLEKALALGAIVSPVQPILSYQIMDIERPPFFRDVFKPWRYSEQFPLPNRKPSLFSTFARSRFILQAHLGISGCGSSVFRWRNP